MNRFTAIKISNFLVFQVGWLACVWGAALGYPWLGLAAVALALPLHLKWADHPMTEIKLLLVCALIGLAFDALLLATAWVAFPNGWWLPGLAPYWMLCLWLLFGTTLNLSMSWMKGRMLAAAVLGAVGGPSAYLAGEKLGGITLLEPRSAIIALAVGWGAIMPLLTTFAAKLNGFTPVIRPEYIQTGFDSGGASTHV